MTFRRHEVTTSLPPRNPAKAALPTLPPQPTTIADSGLTMGFLTDHILKIIYFSGAVTGQQLEELIKLPFLGVIDKGLEFLKLEEFVDIIGAEGGFSERAFQYVITNKGRVKVHEALNRSQYAGPAPVPLSHYLEICRQQQIGTMVIDQATIRRAFTHLIINEKMLDRLGPAVNSARSLFLYGPPGNGKTAIAEGIANMLGGYLLIPYAVEVDGQICPEIRGQIKITDQHLDRGDGFEEIPLIDGLLAHSRCKRKGKSELGRRGVTADCGNKGRIRSACGGKLTAIDHFFNGGEIPNGDNTLSKRGVGEIRGSE